MPDKPSIGDLCIADWLELCLRELSCDSNERIDLKKVRFLVNAAYTIAKEEKNTADMGEDPVKIERDPVKPVDTKELDRILGETRDYLKKCDCNDGEIPSTNVLDSLSYDEIVEYLSKHRPDDHHLRSSELDVNEEITLPRGKVVNYTDKLKTIIPFQHSFDVIVEDHTVMRGLKAKNREELLRLINATKFSTSFNPVILKETDENGKVLFDAEAYGWKVPVEKYHEPVKPEFIDDPKKVVKIMKSMNVVSPKKQGKKKEKKEKKEKKP